MKKIATIEIHAERVKVRVFQRLSDGMEELKTHEYTLDSLEPEKDVRDYVLVLPDEAVHLRYLQLPFQDEERLKEVIPYELQEMTIYRPEEIVFSAIPATDGTVVVGFTEKMSLEALLENLQQKGFNIQRVTSVEMYKALIEKGDSLQEHDSKDELIKEELMDGRIDFLKTTVGYERKLLQIKSLTNAVLRLAVVVLFALGLVIFFQWYPLDSEIKVLKALQQEYFKKIKPEGKAIAPLYQLKAEVKALKEDMERLSHIEPLNLLGLLSSQWSEDIQAEQIELKPEVIIIKGYAKSISQIEALKALLDKEFKEVRMVESEKSADLMRYMIEVKI